MRLPGILVGVFTLSLYGSQLFSLDNYSTKYLSNDELEVFQEQLGRQRAKKHLSLKHSAAYYHERGNKFKEQGELRKAVQNYEYAIFLAPNVSGNYYSSLAEIYYFLGEFSESTAYLRVALRYPFTYKYDRIKALYLLATNYFRLKKNNEALDILKEITGEYQQEIDRQAINGLKIKYEYYAPAFFILSLYYRNNGEIQKYPVLLQKSLQLGFKKDYTSYFLYEVYLARNQDGIAFEYLKRAKESNPNIEEELKAQPWVRTYDLYAEIIKK